MLSAVTTCRRTSVSLYISMDSGEQMSSVPPASDFQWKFDIRTRALYEALYSANAVTLLLEYRGLTD
jgi:hypothetical protein